MRTMVRRQWLLGAARAELRDPWRRAVLHAIELDASGESSNTIAPACAR